MARTTITKIERVRTMLQSPKGATLQAICKVTGWQAHSARAALSGLRKAGYTIAREAAGEDKSGGSVYRITATPEAAE
jgi:Tfp pilus assembly protein PilX